ncbi:MAG: hypothetical protein ABIF84_01015 [Patescibacteria group bacterium]
MSSELDVLKKIRDGGEETSTRRISSQTGFGLDYVRYICSGLTKQGLIKPTARKIDCYSLALRGEKELIRRGVIKPKIVGKADEVKKIIYYLPKKLIAAPAERKTKTRAKLSLKGMAVRAEEKKLNLGRGIMKAVSFLKKLT